MIRILIFVGTILLALGCFVSIASAAETASMPAGQKLFVDKKCNTCHSIESLKVPKKLATSKAPDLSNVGATRNAEWIAKWLKKEVDLNGKKHVSTFSATPADQKALVDWLVTLKAPK